MKIAHLIPQFYPHIGGAEVCVHNICRSLVEKGHEVVVITTSSPPDKAPNLPYRVEYIWEKTCGLFRRLPGFIGSTYLHHKLGVLQNKYNFDLWQVTNGWPLGVFAVHFFRKKRIPCVLRCCGDDIQKYPQIGYGVRLDKRIDYLVKEKYPQFNGFVALTETVRQEYLHIGIPEKKIKIIPNGVDLTKFTKFSSQEKIKLIRTLGIEEPTKPLIITVGRYHPKKGFDLIPQIAEKLIEKGLKFNWVIAGRGVNQIMSKSPKSKNLGLYPIEQFAKPVTDNDIFELPCRELIKAYCASDIFALPTLIETFGMVLVEAMAAGLPIVTTDAQGVRDVIVNGVNGLSVTSGDVKSFADKIATLLQDPDLISRLSASSLATAKKYGWDNVCTQYLDFYSDTISAFR